MKVKRILSFLCKRTHSLAPFALEVTGSKENDREYSPCRYNVITEMSPEIRDVRVIKIMIVIITIIALLFTTNIIR